LYSGKPPTGQGIATEVSTFIKRLDAVNLYKARDVSIINQKTEFLPGELVRSVSAQLSVELKMYKNGSQELQEHVMSIPQAAPRVLRVLIIKINNFYTIFYRIIAQGERQRDAECEDESGRDNEDLELQKDRSTIENYVRLNKMVRRPRHIIPLSPQEDRFVSFS